jgi:hypothetical protein
MRFSWANLEPELLKQISDKLGIQGDPAQELSNRFGARPNESFIKEFWPLLLESWLSHDQAKCRELANSLRGNRLGDASIGNDLEYLKSCSNAKTLRKESLRLFLLAGKTAETNRGESNTSASKNPTPESRAAPLPLNHLAALKSSQIASQPTTDISTPSPQIENSSHKKKSTLKMAAIGFSAAAALSGTISMIIMRQQYDLTVALGQEKHITPLLALSENPWSASINLQQIDTFRRSNWRFYLTTSSLEALNMKGTALHRALEVESLRKIILRQIGAQITDSDLDSAYSRFSQYQHLPAFPWLDATTTQLLQKKVDDLFSRREAVSKRKAEEARKAKEMAEAKEQRRQEAEAQRTAAAEAARAEQEASISGQSGYILGPRGGCYYFSGSSKVYVDRSNCQ